MIDRKHGFVRRFAVTSAAAHDGAQLVNVLDPANTASDVWGDDTAYRSKANEAHLARHGRRSKIHFRRQPGHNLTPSQRKANRVRSKVRSGVETVFAAQKHRFGLFVRTIGLARARTKIGLANLAYNLKALPLDRNPAGGSLIQAQEGPRAPPLLPDRRPSRPEWLARANRSPNYPFMRFFEVSERLDLALLVDREPDDVAQLRASNRTI